MEKKRRARINHCLNELKTLILEAMKKDVSVIFHISMYISVQLQHSVNFGVVDVSAPLHSIPTQQLRFIMSENYFKVGSVVRKKNI